MYPKIKMIKIQHQNRRMRQKINIVGNQLLDTTILLFKVIIIVFLNQRVIIATKSFFALARKLFAYNNSML
jgi:hypothetical protein